MLSLPGFRVGARAHRRPSRAARLPNRAGAGSVRCRTDRRSACAASCGSRPERRARRGRAPFHGRS